MLALLVAACHVWRPAVVGPRQLIEEERPTRIRIVQTDSTRMEVRLPRVLRDSLVAETWGRRKAPQTAGGTAPWVAYHDTLRFALVDVARVETRELSAGRTLGAVILAPVAAYGLFLAWCIPTDCFNR